MSCAGFSWNERLRWRKGNDWTKAARFLSTLDNAGIDKNIATPHETPNSSRSVGGARNSPGGGDPRLVDRVIAKLRKTEGQLFGTLVAMGSVANQGKKNPMYRSDDPYAYLMNITFTPYLRPSECDQHRLRTDAEYGCDRHEEIGRSARRGISGRLNAEGQAVDRGPRSKYGWYGQNNDVEVHQGLDLRRISGFVGRRKYRSGRR